MSVGWFAASTLFALSVAAGCGSGVVESAPDPSQTRCESTFDTTAVRATVRFRAEIAPMLERNGCTEAGCHGGIIASSNYVADTHEGLMMPGEEARAMGLCAVKPGMPDSSYIVWKVEGRPEIQGARMPKGQPPLSAQDLALLRQWVAEGARNN
jgi:hypothetical protein